MGTLFNQSERNYRYVDFKIVRSSCEEIKKIAKELNMNVADVIEIYKAEIQDRAISNRVDDGDRKDEQLAGFGELLKSLTESVEKAVEILETKNADNQ